jgi:hypothetical protein
MIRCSTAATTSASRMPTAAHSPASPSRRNHEQHQPPPAARERSAQPAIERSQRREFAPSRLRAFVKQRHAEFGSAAMAEAKEIAARGPTSSSALATRQPVSELTDEQILALSDSSGNTFENCGGHESPYTEGADTSAYALSFARALLAASPKVEPDTNHQEGAVQFLREWYRTWGHSMTDQKMGDALRVLYTTKSPKVEPVSDDNCDPPCRNVTINSGAAAWPKSCIRCGLGPCPRGVAPNFATPSDEVAP